LNLQRFSALIQYWICVMAKPNEQQLLNARARAVGHRIENLGAAGSYRVHNKKTGAYFIVSKYAELRELISKLEKEDDI